MKRTPQHWILRQTDPPIKLKQRSKMQMLIARFGKIVRKKMPTVPVAKVQRRNLLRKILVMLTNKMYRIGEMLSPINAI